jgi:two-component system, OmpR family, sensor kinase
VLIPNWILFAGLVGSPIRQYFNLWSLIRGCVNNLLLLARADAGRSLANEPFQIPPVIDETDRRVRLLDSQRQINLNTTPDLDINGDRDAFKQVILILLDNASKHSEGDINVCVQDA